MLITTNETFQEKKINQYLGQVNEQIVVGANIFKDVFASFRDVFGGETKGYKKELDKLKQASLKGLTDQAKQLNANGVIGFRMDIDEISGGGKSMFMLNVFGTAVEFDHSTAKEDSSLGGNISSEVLNHQVKRLTLKESIQTGSSHAKDIGITTLIEYEIYDFTESLIEKFDENLDSKDDLIKYFVKMPSANLEDYLQNNIHIPNGFIWNQILTGLNNKEWLDINFLIPLLRDDSSVKRFRALHLCTMEKKHYTIADIKLHRKLFDFLNNEFDTEIDTLTKEGTFSTSDVWKCPKCLSDNKVSKDKCTNCRADKFGFKKTSFDQLKKNISRKITVLEEAFN